MTYTVMTTKGQFTIPLQMRKVLGLRTGERMDFAKNPATGHYEVLPRTGSFKSLFGLLKSDKPAPTVEEMNETIRKGWAGEL